MSLRYDQVADLIRIIDASACEELVLETAELKLVVRRGRSSSVEPAPSPSAAASRPAPGSEPKVAETASGTPKAAAASAGSQRSSGHEIRSPMVGTFYRAPSPDAPPFVEAGSTVSQGQPLCIIEVMKLFTTIYADRAGRIAEIAAANGDLVEYEQVLFVIED